MEILLIIGLLIGIIYLIGYLKEKFDSRHTSLDRTPDTIRSVRPKHDPNVFRPTASRGNQKQSTVKFKSTDNNKKDLAELDIEDLVDALTGAALNIKEPLFQCQRCKVYYQLQSIEVIRVENAGRCVSCLNTNIVSVASKYEQRGRNADVSAVTLNNYRQYVGHVITFEGRVCNVLTSRRGKDYAVMFEDLSWTKGFKMVAFRGAVDRIGGEKFLYSLVNRTVRVRGLLINHTEFGYEIIISDPRMILSVR